METTPVLPHGSGAVPVLPVTPHASERVIENDRTTRATVHESSHLLAGLSRLQVKPLAASDMGPLQPAAIDPACPDMADFVESGGEVLEKAGFNPSLYSDPPSSEGVYRKIYEGALRSVFDMAQRLACPSGSSETERYRALCDALRKLPRQESEHANAFWGMALVYCHALERLHAGKEAFARSFEQFEGTVQAMLEPLAAGAPGCRASAEEVASSIYKLVLDPRHIKRYERGATHTIPKTEHLYELTEPGYMHAMLKGLEKVYSDPMAEVDVDYIEKLHGTVIEGVFAGLPSPTRKYVVQNRVEAPKTREAWNACAAKSAFFEPQMREAGEPIGYGVMMGRNWLSPAGWLELQQLNPELSCIQDAKYGENGELITCRVYCHGVGKTRLKAEVAALLDRYRAEIADARNLPDFHARENAIALAIARLGAPLVRLHPFLDGNARTVKLLLLKMLAENGMAPSVFEPSILGGWSAQEIADELMKKRVGTSG